MRVAVIGGGVMGAATSWRLTKRGADVVCFDRFSPPHAEGSSHGSTRIIRSAYFEGPHYVPLIQESFELWRELESASGTRLLTMTGALMIGSETSEAVTGALASAKQHGLDVEFLTGQALRKRYRGHVVHEGDVAVLDRQAGILDAEGAVNAMLSQAPPIKSETLVEAVDDVLKDFDSVVVAAGPWTPELVDWFPPDRFPVFIRQTEDFGDVYGFPALDGRTVKVGRHHDGDFTDPHHIKRRVDETDMDPLRLICSTYLRGVSGHAARAVTCMYTNTPDHDFVIDFSPHDKRVVVISACSGHGFKFAPVVGDIAAELVCDGSTSRDISRFSAARFAASSHVPNDQANRD